jgi:serine/threonine protein kinase
MKTIDHPFLLKLVYTFQTPQNLFMALEFCESGDLSHIINKFEVLGEQTAKFVAAELILGI